jgi:hypothetical protein
MDEGESDTELSSPIGCPENIKFSSFGKYGSRFRI